MTKRIDIPKLRKRLKLSQIEFARLLGVNQGTVSRLETGVMVPSGPVRVILEQLAAE